MGKKGEENNTSGAEPSSWSQLDTKAKLNEFLTDLRDKLVGEKISAIYALTALNGVMSMPTIYDLLDAKNRTLATEIWDELKKAGVQIKDPPLLYG